MSVTVKPSLYVSFPVGHEVDGEDVLEREPGRGELVENKAATVGTEDLVVEIHLDLVSRGVERDLQIMVRISILSHTGFTSIYMDLWSKCNRKAKMMILSKRFPIEDLLPC